MKPLADVQGSVALRRLSIFADAFGFDAASAVWESVGETEENLISQLETLRDAGEVELVSAISGSPPVFRLTDHGRSSIAESSSESDEEAAVQSAHAEYSVSLIERLVDDLESTEPPAASTLLERSYIDLGSALFWKIEHDEADRASSVAWSLVPYWRAHSLILGRRLTESLLAAATLQAAGAEQLRILDLLGLLAYLAADFAAARSWYQRGLQACRSLEKERQVPHWLQELGRACIFCGDLRAAHGCAEELLTGFDRYLDPHERIAALNMLATAALEGDNLVVSREVLETALIIAGTIDDADRSTLAGLLNSLGHVAFDQGNLDEAFRLYRESLKRWRQLGDPQGIAYLLGSLGNVTLLMGKYAESRAAFAESLQIEWSQGDEGSVCVALRCLACVAGLQGQHERVIILEAAAKVMYTSLPDYELVTQLQPLLQQVLEAAKVAQGVAQARKSLATGRAMQTADAVAYALTG